MKGYRVPSCEKWVSPRWQQGHLVSDDFEGAVELIRYDEGEVYPWL